MRYKQDILANLTASHVSELQEILSSERVLTNRATLKSYDCDAYTIDRSLPDVVVLPESTNEVAQIVRWCFQNDIPYTVRGAGTGLSGGALAAMGGVIISTKRLNQILEIDLEHAALRAQTGIANRRISDAVLSHGLHFAPDPSSQAVSTLGGNIAENSGGPHTLKYGVTAPHLLGVVLVDPEGEIHHIGNRYGQQCGYDLLGLICGSEGTLGIVTEAWVKLTPNPLTIQTALIAFSGIRDATESVAAIIESGVIPAALEMMDKGVMRALQLAFDLSYPDSAQALLLIECDSSVAENAEEIVASEMKSVLAICHQFRCLNVEIAKDAQDRARLWTARKKGIGAMGRLAPSIVTHDGVIPRSKLPEMLDYVYQIASETNIGVANIFHAGDGNLHPCFYFDDRIPAQVEAVIMAGEKILEKCLELGGSISGEHGIGVEKLDLMPKMFDPDSLELQRLCKMAFNEGALCNPCKVLPSQKGCIEHQKRWRGSAW